MKAVIFDRDGVIIDSETLHIDSVIKAFDTFNIKITEEEKKLIIGRHPEDYKKFFINKNNFQYDKFREIQRKEFRELFKSASLFKETITLIKKLYELKIPLALTTSAGIKSTLEVVENANIKNMFNFIITSEDYNQRKPHPEPYLITAKKLKLNPKDCIVIEDSYVGVESAKNAGMKCIAISNKLTNQDLSKADLIVNSAKEINIDLLNQL
ncbi:HAD family phosphatase [Candidatus Woesearchaeota archaeon]|jgi:HAD superfamily hydrolase (TIGR01509 family)|nr:HAD family phosphatase [Candidatus Woesearchaeota archaeon]MBT4387617.1 HAD family phosphatase [Candidatus Woesearchaeota archaeon]MBT4596020.1 HAD family phosphatase [Candidatus Woesearchaeota archaeon]MBT5740727.1 HAD family phosphatase [Candidatus Woesearchaeota archaeon]MBT6506167.1 HAD family phosphatase [Candidatus Woesearchaeota archaeon]